MAKFTVQMDEEEFRIVGPGGEIGEAVDYDSVATLVIGEDVYICRVEDPDALEQRVERVDQSSLMPTVIEEVLFADDADDNDEDEDGGGDDDGEPVAVVEETEEDETAA